MLMEFLDIERRLALRRTSVLFATLWMTWRAFAWAAVYASSFSTADGMIAAAAMIAAVTAPITYLQAAVFKAYIESK